MEPTREKHMSTTTTTYDEAEARELLILAAHHLSPGAYKDERREAALALLGQLGALIEQGALREAFYMGPHHGPRMGRRVFDFGVPGCTLTLQVEPNGAIRLHRHHVGERKVEPIGEELLLPYDPIQKQLVGLKPDSSIVPRPGERPPLRSALAELVDVLVATIRQELTP